MEAPMPRSIPPPLSLVLTYLRTARGWTQQDLAGTAGVGRQLICDLEKGTRRTLDRETLEGLATAMDYSGGDVTLALLFLGGLQAGGGLRTSPIEPSAAEYRRARRIAARVGLTETSRRYQQLLDLARARRVEQARRHGARLWEMSRRCPAGGLRERIRRLAELHDWALAERLCDESERAAADDAARALELARAALLAAELSPGDEAWHAWLEGYCWAFIGNAQRVGSDLAAAERSFATAWRLWGEAGPAEGRPVGEWRLLDLEASLRRDQRQVGVALDLLERALATAPAAARGRILLKKQYTQEQAGDIAAALVTLEEAAPLVEASGDANLLWSLGMNRLVMLAHLRRFKEAEAGVPELRKAAIKLGRRLDLTRLVWLGGRIAAGRGRREEAGEALGQARREFAELGDGYDAALVTLELAILRLEEGRAGEAAALADEMVAIFSSLRVQRETLAALRLFWSAARAHTATAEMARQLLASLENERGGVAAGDKRPE
jgi:transcriptional regulator with XRE-family HTH domain